MIYSRVWIIPTKYETLGSPAYNDYVLDLILFQQLTVNKRCVGVMKEYKRTDDYIKNEDKHEKVKKVLFVVNHHKTSQITLFQIYRGSRFMVMIYNLLVLLLPCRRQ